MNIRHLFVFLFYTFLCFSQQTELVNFKKIQADIDFDTSQNKVFGYATYDFEILKPVDAIYIDAQDMRFMRVKLFHKDMILDNHFNGYVESFNEGRRLIIEYEFKKKKKYQIRLRYFANPKKAMYFIDWDKENSNKQIWTQGQGKYTSNWLPSIDDMNDKIEFDLNISFNNNYKVISNGKLYKKETIKNKTTWHYDMQKPMSSYLLALAIGKYDKKTEYSKSGIPLEMYYYPQDSLKVESTYRYTKQMFDFLEEEIGVPYPWQNYKQVPVKDFLYAGMENTSLTIFSDAFVVDSIAFVDKNYVNVNAHELAHQWFGDFVTETSGTHHWLQEGFATYYALLAEKEVFGNDYYYNRLYEYADELQEQHKARQSTILLDPNSSSTTFYKKGAWVLHLLREEIGDKSFRTAVKNYLKKFKFKNVETNDFLHEVEKASKKNLSKFKEEWLLDKNPKYDKLISSIKKSGHLKGFLDLEKMDFNEANLFPLKKSLSDQAKSKLVKLNPDKITSEDFNNNLIVRQAIAQSVKKIPVNLKESYETLLDDKSYKTIEAALFSLWNNFPENRNKYLNKTKNIVGFNDKNIRILWLTLALISKDYEPKNSELYFKELEGYTSPRYGFEIRQNAFGYLKHINSCTDECEKNLKEATKHHNWRFSKFAKDLLNAK